MTFVHGKRVVEDVRREMRSLQLLDELVAEGRNVVTPSLVQARTGQSAQAAVNMLTRLVDAGLLDRVARGRYVVRPIGLLRTSAVAEDVSLAVGALFEGKPHRIAYRSALDHHGVLVHPARTVQVASPTRIKISSVSGRPLRAILEKSETIRVGANRAGEAWVSDVERALVDAASRPELIGGISVLAQALSIASPDPERLLSYGSRLGRNAAIRRIGSVADRLEIEGLAGTLRPLAPPKSDIDLDTTGRGSRDEPVISRDRHWFVRWHLSVDELASSVGQ